ncbi:MAG: putative calcium/calmodulin-dependent protein kinase I delta short [Streblomastix strix]|uniref:mitogen-activated protein kinase kinase n=1 Tax=Streblomastix strix TaxID=222440 RepID=A0A5J4VV48_9EUKA|nr:MAG: putative calcium/calmodulin-dependent protein kinase I delta short [Streblomastix strix]
MEESWLLTQQGFKIFKTLGKGGYGSVYLVNHSELGTIAAKVIDKENFNEQEWNIAGIFEKDVPQNRPFVIQNILARRFDKYVVILMEYCNLQSLFDLNRTVLLLPIPIVRAIMKQLLQGLSYIHSKGIIHRDIKGTNIMLHSPLGSGRINLKIVDFGLTKIKQTGENSQLMSRRGTEQFMPPEIYLSKEKGQIKADATFDVWSAGIIFYQLVAKQFPYDPSQNDSQRKFMEKKKLKRPERVKDDLCWELITKMLAFDRKKRICASDALKHKFFTGEQANREITEEQHQLAQVALVAQQRGDQNISQFDLDPSYIFPYTEANKMDIKYKQEVDMANPQQQNPAIQFQRQEIYHQVKANQYPYQLQQPQQQPGFGHQNIQQAPNAFFQGANFFGRVALHDPRYQPVIQPQPQIPFVQPKAYNQPIILNQFQKPDQIIQHQPKPAINQYQNIPPIQQQYKYIPTQQPDPLQLQPLAYPISQPKVPWPLLPTQEIPLVQQPQMQNIPQQFNNPYQFNIPQQIIIPQQVNIPKQVAIPQQIIIPQQVNILPPLNNNPAVQPVKPSHQSQPDQTQSNLQQLQQKLREQEDHYFLLQNRYNSQLQSEIEKYTGQVDQSRGFSLDAIPVGPVRNALEKMFEEIKTYEIIIDEMQQEIYDIIFPQQN